MGTVVSRDRRQSQQQQQQAQAQAQQAKEKQTKKVTIQEDNHQKNESPAKKVKVEFFWPFQANHVGIIGSWDNWKNTIPLVKPNGERKTFKVKINLEQRKHQFKFIVDGIEKVNPRLPKEHIKGKEVNYYDFKNIPEGERQRTRAASDARARDRARSKPIKYVDWNKFEWGQREYEFEIYRKSPPAMPPHLPYTPLNMMTPQSKQPLNPMHVTLNHLYISEHNKKHTSKTKTNKKQTTSNYVTYGLTTRLENRYITYCFYGPKQKSTQQQTNHAIQEQATT